MNKEPQVTSDVSPLTDLKSGPSFDFSIVAGVFFVGISVGALIPVGMKFFGYWKVQSVSSLAEKAPVDANKTDRVASKALPPTETAEPLRELETKPVASLETRPVLPATVAVKEPVAKPIPASVLPEQKVVSRRSSEPSPKPVQVRGKIEGVIAEPVSVAQDKRSMRVQAEVQVAELEKKAAQKSRKAPAESAPAEILEEVAGGPSALEIQNLTAAYLKQQTAPAALPVSAQPIAMPAKVATISSVETPREEPAAGAQNAVALSINNASYTKTNLEECKKRCLLLGLDAFGMPVKAIISGPNYAQALMQHKGTINLAGQPRLIKNQQVLIVDSITFNLSPSVGGTAKADIPTAINASYAPSDKDAKSMKAKR